MRQAALAGLAALLLATVPVDAGAQRARRGRRAEPERPAPPLVRLVVRDTAIEVTGAAPRAGLVRVRLVNRDSAWHDALLVRHGDSTAAAPLGPSHVPSGAQLQGGPGLVANGDSAEVAVTLEPGAWTIAVRGADSTRAWRPVPLAVAPRAAGDPRPAVKGRVLLSMADFRFELDDDLGEGTQVLRVRNDGTRPHELVVYRLLSGRTLRDFGTWYTTTRAGPPPALPVGGATLVAPGADAWATLSLRPGRYFMVCTVLEGAESHAQRGMVLAFEVEP